ncbi:MAG TPA: DUF3047 domain-containing protein [Methylomirabilota bacterium]|nr:DUF3047 domain-containing protein [Methylomirabilota bacterium]
MRQLFVGILAIALVAAAPANSIVVEDWAKEEVGRRGVPLGWQGQNWGSPKYDFTVVSEGHGKVLHLRSEDDSSTISKELKVDVKQYPILQWRWKVAVLPKGGDARRKEADDEAIQLYVTFPRFPSAVRSRIIGYIWDSSAPVGAFFPSQKVSTVNFVVVRSGAAELGKWHTETRNVLEDYKRIHGEEPGESVGAVSVSINSQNTHSRAESYLGEILFRKP